MSQGQPPYLLEGRNYPEEDLTGFCRSALADPDTPDWKKGVFGFITGFLEGGPMFQESSGTTGIPKKFVLDRKAMQTSARKTLSWFGLERGDPVLLCLPVRYIAGKMMIVRALLGGLDLHLKEPDSRPFREEKRKFSFVPLVPLQLYESLKNQDDISLTDTILIGGAESGPGLRKLLGNIGTPGIFESFGMTETYSHFALRRINGPAPDPLFRVMEGIQTELDGRGCLVVNIPGITSGPVVTNDMVEIFEDGRSFRWLGRADNLINTGGIKLNPELLEDRIASILGTEGILVSVPDEGLGMKMVLVAEGDPEKRLPENWLASLKMQLASHEVPRQIIPVASLPRNASFKPDRTEVRRVALKWLGQQP
jgi:O-succinylbenzoic acid--CoA ligase